MTLREPVQLSNLHALVRDAIGADTRLAFLARFPGQDTAPDILRLFFAARCACGVAAMLTLEVSRTKTGDEIRKALPYLLSTLRERADLFYRLPCERHAAMKPQAPPLDQKK
ncbi:MAG: hypothetical protein AAB502_11990 [Chloroflexota bacterium]